MPLPETEDGYQEIRAAVRALCAEFPDEYHRKIAAAHSYPEAFVEALTKAGWLAAMIPQDFGGSGLGLAEASVIMEEVNRSGGNAGACHGQMYNMGTLLRHGSAEQKARYLPAIARGELRLQSMAVTEPSAGTDTTKIKTTAVRKGDRYIVSGQKVWISRIQHSDLMILLARTAPADQVTKRSDGLSIFIVDVHQALAKGMDIRPIANMVGHETNEVFFDELEIPAENLIGEEGKGFRYILDSLNPERILIGSEAIGIGRDALRRAANYARERVVFDRPIGMNQGIQHPLAERWMYLESAFLMCQKAAHLYDSGKPCGAEANAAKFLAARASHDAAWQAIVTHGGMGYAKEYHVERLYREAAVTRIVPITEQLIMSFIAEKVLDLPKSY